MTTKKKTPEGELPEMEAVHEEQTPGEISGEAPPREQERTPADDFQDKYLRLMADFQNYKRRSEKERTEVHAFSNEKIITHLLGVLDNFERALAQEPGEEAPFREGMGMIAEQFVQVLKKEGLEEIKAINEPFDPRLHHAIMMDSSGDNSSGHVTDVLQKGYLFKGKVIRPAVVKVAE